MLQLVKDNSRIQKEDKDYLAAKGKIIAESLKELVEKKLAFAKLSTKANTTTTATLSEYLNQVNEINATVERIRITIQEAAIISVDTLPSSTVTVNGKSVQTGTGSIINISKAVEPFMKTLVTLTEECNDMRFEVLGHKGAYPGVVSNALNPDLSSFPKMDEEEVAAALLEIEKNQLVSKSTKDKQQLFADQIVKAVKTYITNVGTEQFLRPRNGNDFTYLAESYRNLEQMFLMRSYLRKKYGLQIGAIQPKSYPVMKFSLEGIFKKEMLFPVTNALNTIRSQTAQVETDLSDAYNNARRFVEFYDRSLTPTLSEDASKKREEIRKEQVEKDQLLKDASLWEKARSQVTYRIKLMGASIASRDEIMSKKHMILNEEGKDVSYNSDDTGLFARISGATTFFTGQTSTVEALLAVMRLVVADIQEELMLARGDWSTLQSHHQQRFMSTAEQTKRTVKVICDIDTNLSEEARERARSITSNAVACKKAPTGLIGTQNNAGNALTTFRNIMTSYESVEMKRAQMARSLRMLVEQSMNAQAQEGDRSSPDASF